MNRCEYFHVLLRKRPRSLAYQLIPPFEYRSYASRTDGKAISLVERTYVT